MPQRNLAVDLLQKLIRANSPPRGRGMLCRRARSPRCWSRPFAVTRTGRYRRHKVIEKLIQLAKDMQEANARGESLGLSEDELAFHDALETNDSAVQVLGDETLRTIASGAGRDRS